MLGLVVCGSRTWMWTIAAPALAASIADCAICAGVTGTAGFFPGVSAEPVTAQAIITLRFICPPAGACRGKLSAVSARPDTGAGQAESSGRLDPGQSRGLWGRLACGILGRESVGGARELRRLAGAPFDPSSTIPSNRRTAQINPQDRALTPQASRPDGVARGPPQGRRTRYPARIFPAKRMLATRNALR